MQDRLKPRAFTQLRLVHGSENGRMRKDSLTSMGTATRPDAGARRRSLVSQMARPADSNRGVIETNLQTKQSAAPKDANDSASRSNAELTQQQLGNSQDRPTLASEHMASTQDMDLKVVDLVDLTRGEEAEQAASSAKTDEKENTITSDSRDAGTPQKQPKVRSIDTPNIGRKRRDEIAATAAVAATLLSLAACAQDYAGTPVSNTQATLAARRITPGVNNILNQVLTLYSEGEVTVSYPEPLNPTFVDLTAATPAYANPASTSVATGRPEGKIFIEGYERVQGHPEEGVKVTSMQMQVDDNSGPHKSLEETAFFATDPDESLRAFSPNQWLAFVLNTLITPNGNLIPGAPITGDSTGPTNWYDYNNPGQVKHKPWRLTNATAILSTAEQKFDEIRPQLVRQRPNTRRTQHRG